MKKLGILLAFTAILGFSLAPAQAAEGMVNAQLASILVSAWGLEMPADASSLSDSELYEVQANLLAANGFTQLIGTEADAAVTKETFAHLLYDALVGPNDASAEEKIAFLVELGHMTAGLPNDPADPNKLLEALNNPGLAGAIAETYTSPGITPPAGTSPNQIFEVPQEEGAASPVGAGTSRIYSRIHHRIHHHF